MMQQPSSFEVREPRKSLSQATESASAACGRFGDHERSHHRWSRSDRHRSAGKRLQRYLRSYGTGIQITKVNIDRSAPPVQVQDAFNDVQKAKEDRQRFENQAIAYAQQVVPEARGRAQRQIEEAQAYRDRVIARSDGEAQRFEKLLTEYQRAPEVTRDRLYLDALEKVFKNSSKVMVDVEGGNNMMYLPLDKLAQRAPEVALDRDVVRAAVEELRRELD
ncbi:MAG: FtsH protease activity modulator HflK [Candidatus Azotimanducaceae bacterium]